MNQSVTKCQMTQIRVKCILKTGGENLTWNKRFTEQSPLEWRRERELHEKRYAAERRGGEIPHTKEVWVHS